MRVLVYFLIFFSDLQAFAGTPLPKKPASISIDQLVWDEPLTSKTSTDIESSGSSFKIFWWNIGCNIVNAKLEQKHKPGLYENLLTLAQIKESPHMIVLGEFCHKKFNKSKWEELKKFYPNEYHLIKSNPNFGIDNGLLVLSKFPFEVVQKKLISTVENQEPNENTRSYVLIKLMWEGRQVYISPLHLNNPWRKLMSANKLQDFLIKIFEKDNSNYLQAELFLKEYKKDLPEDSNFLIFGDFNSGKNFMNLKNMASYDLFLQNYLFLENDNFTFPSKTSKATNNKFPSVIIDHAFASKNAIGKSIVLPLKGSDHYPLFIEVDKF